MYIENKNIRCKWTFQIYCKGEIINKKKKISGFPHNKIIQISNLTNNKIKRMASKKCNAPNKYT